MSSEELRNIFSDNLNYWLEYRGKTQADLYRITGVSSATASDWCNGKKIPRTDKIVDIARWLMVEVGELLYENNHVKDPVDPIIYRIKDDEIFRNTVIDLNNFNIEQYQRVRDYIELLKKSLVGV